MKEIQLTKLRKHNIIKLFDPIIPNKLNIHVILSTVVIYLFHLYIYNQGQHFSSQMLWMCAGSDTIEGI